MNGCVCVFTPNRGKGLWGPLQAVKPVEPSISSNSMSKPISSSVNPSSSVSTKVTNENGSQPVQKAPQTLKKSAAIIFDKLRELNKSLSPSPHALPVASCALNVAFRVALSGVTNLLAKGAKKSEHTNQGKQILFNIKRNKIRTLKAKCENNNSK
ncbi:hypothetical protein PGB90_008595 [Kerria lacca]